MTTHEQLTWGLAIGWQTQDKSRVGKTLSDKPRTANRRLAIWRDDENQCLQNLHSKLNIDLQVFDNGVKNDGNINDNSIGNFQ